MVLRTGVVEVILLSHITHCHYLQDTAKLNAYSYMFT